MSETPVESTPAQESEVNEKPETDWKTEARKWERLAKENKTAAQRLAEIEEAQKTAEQKAAERLAEAERKAAEAERRVLIATEANTSGVPVYILEGPRDDTPEALSAWAKEISDYAAGKRKQGNYVPNEGRTPQNGGPDETREFVRNLFRPNH